MEIVKTSCFVIVVVLYAAFDSECGSESGGGQNGTQSTTNLNQSTTVSTEITRNTTAESKTSPNTAKPDSRKDKPSQTTTFEPIILLTTSNHTGTTTNSEVASTANQTTHNGTMSAYTNPKVIVPGDGATTSSSPTLTPNDGTTSGKTNKNPTSSQAPANPILNNATTKGQDTVTQSTSIQNLATPASATANPGGIAAGVIFGIAALFIIVCVVRRRLRRNRRDEARRQSLFNNPIRFEEDTIL